MAPEKEVEEQVMPEGIAKMMAFQRERQMEFGKPLLKAMTELRKKARKWDDADPKDREEPDTTVRGAKLNPFEVQLCVQVRLRTKAREFLEGKGITDASLSTTLRSAWGTAAVSSDGEAKKEVAAVLLGELFPEVGIAEVYKRFEKFHPAGGISVIPQGREQDDNRPTRSRTAPAPAATAERPM